MVQIKTVRTVLDLVTLSRGQAVVTSFYFYSFTLTTSSLGKDAQINLMQMLPCRVLFCLRSPLAPELLEAALALSEEPEAADPDPAMTLGSAHTSRSLVI